MNYCYRKGIQKCVLYWEVVPFSERALSEISQWISAATILGTGNHYFGISVGKRLSLARKELQFLYSYHVTCPQSLRK